MVHDPSQTPNPFYQPLVRTSVWPGLIGSLVAFFLLLAILGLGMLANTYGDEPVPMHTPTTYGPPPN